jgi:hypothetical protein
MGRVGEDFLQDEIEAAFVDARPAPGAGVGGIIATLTTKQSMIILPRLPVREGDRFPLDLRLRQRPGLRKGISSSLAPRANGPAGSSRSCSSAFGAISRCRDPHLRHIPNWGMIDSRRRPAKRRHISKFILGAIVGMKLDQAKHLKDVKREDDLLHKAVWELTPDKQQASSARCKIIAQVMQPSATP